MAPVVISRVVQLPETTFRLLGSTAKPDRTRAGVPVAVPHLVSPLPANNRPDLCHRSEPASTRHNARWTSFPVPSSAGIEPEQNTQARRDGLQKPFRQRREMSSKSDAQAAA